MKLNRSSLKSLVKECLVEILSEGLSETSSMMIESAPTRKKATRKREPAPRRPALDTVKFDNAIDNSVQHLTEDPVMSSIFADTARTTLQEQLSEDGRTGHGASVSAHGDPAAKAAASSDPSDLFGEASTNWAALAFDK
jgi:hypothetical protein